MWGGRFKSATNPALKNLNASIHTDKRMFYEDICGSQMYAKTLEKIGLLTTAELHEIFSGLEQVKQEWTDQKCIIKDDEDIHSANECRLKEIIGNSAHKLHVGRSRNDQVTTDMRLWLRNALHVLQSKLITFVDVMVKRSKVDIDVLFPGYTHLQRAQPVRWSHWLLSHAWYFKADADKLLQLFKSTNVMPLGSGALAGNPFGIDREALAKDLGFDAVTPNSMQAVGDRDYISEFLFWASLVGVHMTRLAEDLIIYSSKEFGFVRIHDSFSTGSSLMPQKRNPDSLELARGLGSGIFGQCCSFMMTLSSLPSTYNKDLQSDKELMFGAYDKLIGILDVVTGTVETLEIDQQKCTEALTYDMLATDLAYYLVRKGVPFREAHHIAGQVVATSEARNVDLCDLTLQELKTISEHFDEDVSKVWNYENSVEQYHAFGGTAKESVLGQIQLLDEWLSTSIKIPQFQFQSKLG